LLPPRPTPTHIRQFPIASQGLRGSDTHSCHVDSLIRSMITNLNEAATILHLHILERQPDSKSIHQLLSTFPTCQTFCRPLTATEQRREHYGLETRMRDHTLSILSKSFVYTLDGIHKTLCQLDRVTRGEDQHAKIHEALQDFDNHFHPDAQQPNRMTLVPHLKNVADSIRHLDERMIDKVKSKPLPRHPRANVFAYGVHTPGANHSWHITYYGATGVNNTVELSYHSLEVTQTCIQDIVDAYVYSDHTSTT